MLVAEGIHKSFPGAPEILRGVNLVLKPGTITAVVGPSGGGKSTLLRTLALLEEPTGGTITIDDIPCSVSNIKRSRSPWPNVTMVFQQLFLWPHLTLRENIFLPQRFNEGVPPGEIDALIEEFDLDPIVDRYPNQVSLGQQQRAALIRAVSLNPRYLLLDEVTSALDVEQVDKLIDLLKRLRTREFGVLIVTHLLGIVQDMDYVIFLDNGRVVDEGSPERFFRSTNSRTRRFLSVSSARVPDVIA